MRTSRAAGSPTALLFKGHGGSISLNAKVGWEFVFLNAYCSWWLLAELPNCLENKLLQMSIIQSLNPNHLRVRQSQQYFRRLNGLTCVCDRGADSVWGQAKRGRGEHESPSRACEGPDPLHSVPAGLHRARERPRLLELGAAGQISWSQVSKVLI